MLFFYAILVAGVATISLFGLILMRFVSGSLLAAMGGACSGIFRASQGFLAASRWNYLMMVGAAAVFFAQAAFLFGGGTRLIKISSRFKKNRTRLGMSCPALKKICPLPWAARAYFLPGEEAVAQTVGILRPRILIGEGLANSLSFDELKIVLAHEEAHRRGRDNLMLALARAVSLALFYLPGIRMAYREMRVNLEKAADEKAALCAGGPIPVASALVKILKLCSRREAIQPVDQIATSVGGAGSSDISDRLDNLVNHAQFRKCLWRVPVAFLVLSVAVLLSFTASAWAVSGSGQRDAFVCFTEHEHESPPTGVCELDHPQH